LTEADLDAESDDDDDEDVGLPDLTRLSSDSEDSDELPL
jgi:hypothetical protein